MQHVRPTLRWQGLTIFLICFTLAALSAHHTHAHAYNPPYTWYSSRATFQSYRAATFRHGITEAQQDYDWHTDLTVSYTTSNSGGFGYVQFIEGNYYQDWIGLTDAYNQFNQSCTYLHCNTTDKRAHYASVYLDLQDKNWIAYTHPGFVERHEAGHVFGMAHGTCEEPSVMKPHQYCAAYPTYLEPHDKDFINTRY